MNSRTAGATVGLVIILALAVPSALASHDPHTRDRWCVAGEAGCAVGRNYDAFAAAFLPEPFGTQLQNWMCGGSAEVACTLAKKVDAGTFDLVDAAHGSPSAYVRMGGLAAGTAYSRAEEAATFACAAGAPCFALP